MDAIQLLIRSVLYRKSQRGLAEELSIPKTTLNRILQGIGSFDDIDSDALGDAYHNYPMPEGLSPESSIQVNIPFCLRSEYGYIMERMYIALQGTRFETSFRMQEIRKLLAESADYNEGQIYLSETKIAEAKAKLEEFARFKQSNGQILEKFDYWIRHNQETIQILETAYRSNFRADTSALEGGIKLVFDLKNSINAHQEGTEQKRALEFLLITSAAQTAEILFEGGYGELIPDVTNIIADTFGKFAEANFKLLMVASAWPHNQAEMKKQAKQGHFNSNKHRIKGVLLTQRKYEILEAITPQSLVA